MTFSIGIMTFCITIFAMTCCLFYIILPSSTNNDVGNNVGYYNAMVDKLYDEYGDRLVHGPDFDDFFKKNTWGLSADGVHPNSEGYES